MGMHDEDRSSVPRPAGDEGCGAAIMPAMPRVPALIGLAVLASSTVWAIVVVSTATRLSTSAAALLGLDVVVLAAVVVAGMLLGRSRWSRASALGLLGLQLVFVPALPTGGWRLVALALTGVAAVGVAGPWLRSWLRHLPNAEGPPASVVVLLLGLLGLPAVAALANPTGTAWGSWLLAAVAVVAAWAFGRAWVPALWVLRLGLLPAGIPALFQSTRFGAAILLAAIVALAALSWSRDVGLVVRPLLPQRADVFPIPPELAPPDVLREAGYDERGRRPRP